MKFPINSVKENLRGRYCDRPCVIVFQLISFFPSRICDLFNCVTLIYIATVGIPADVITFILQRSYSPSNTRYHQLSSRIASD